MTTTNKLIYKGTSIILLLVLLVFALVHSKSFIAPLTVAMILALLLVPVVRQLETWKLSKNIASILATLGLFIVSMGFFVLVMVQMNNVVDKWDKIKDTMEPKIESANQWLVTNTPLTDKKIEGFKKRFKNFKIIGSSQLGNSALAYLSGIVGFLGNYLLVFVYVFFMLRFRTKFKRFILKFFSDDRRNEVKQTLHEITKVAQGYLLGKLKLIGLLAIVYSIGLGISGVSNFMLVALIAALLTIIPYLGNIIGYGLALIFGYLMNGEMGVLVGITITFVVAQFFESYVLQPYVVGDEVDLNPFFTILAVIAGNLMWGIVGMVVAIPVLGIINVVFLHIPCMHPFGFLLKKVKES